MSCKQGTEVAYLSKIIFLTGIVYCLTQDEVVGAPDTYVKMSS